MGYTLVYCESNGVNLFFVRSDIAATMGVNFGSVETIYRKPKLTTTVWAGSVRFQREENGFFVVIKNDRIIYWLQQNRVSQFD
jgi:hypothetical protein